MSTSTHPSHSPADPAEARQAVAWWPEFLQADGRWKWATVRPCETHEQARSIVANHPDVVTRIVPLYRD